MVSSTLLKDIFGMPETWPRQAMSQKSLIYTLYSEYVHLLYDPILDQPTLQVTTQ